MKMSQRWSQVGPTSSVGFTSSGVGGATLTTGGAGATWATVGLGSAWVRRHPLLPRNRKVIAQMGMIAGRTLTGTPDSGEAVPDHIGPVEIREGQLVRRREKA